MTCPPVEALVARFRDRSATFRPASSMERKLAKSIFQFGAYRDRNEDMKAMARVE